ncbi:hypothetical protein PsYK624_169160 [Phanerochaete sordida]|uniref:Uncharacterized protein n=1 Tax=Phanerochaete sordida TaxID=48140 RepID=A0A9P3GT99_9APHY|nr:hypothetical protein PsYK624_169160 [Phanerochaete sordida]
MSDDACGALCGALLAACCAGTCQDFASIRHACLECHVSDPAWCARASSPAPDAPDTASTVDERAPLLVPARATQPAQAPPMVVAKPADVVR